MCIYCHIRAVKTQQTICQIASLCNIQHYVIYNYMFRPCKKAIIRLFLEPVIGLYNTPIVQLLVQGTTWWWPSYKAETCSCIWHSVVYYTVILSDISFVVFWLHICESIYTFYAVLISILLLMICILCVCVSYTQPNSSEKRSEKLHILLSKSTGCFRRNSKYFRRG
jgi:hypothetical protein